MNSLFSFPSEQLWDSFKKDLSSQLHGESGYEKFIESMAFVAFEEGKLCIELKSEIAVDFARRYYAERIRNFAQLHYAGLDRVEFVCRNAPPVDFQLLVQPQAPVKEKAPAKRPKRSEPKIDSVYPLDAEQHFGSFAVGNSNQQAYHSAKRVAENPGLSNFNPLFLHGGPGLGKTHLLQSVAWFAKDHQTARKIVYRTSDELVREFFQKLTDKKGPAAFQSSLRQCDLLLIDDVQFFNKKEFFQREIISLMDYMVSQRKQVILVSDRPPAEVHQLSSSLRDKFGSGLVLDVRAPEHELRKDILRQLAQRKQYTAPLDSHVVEYLSQIAHGDARTLSGILTKVIAYCEMNKEPITIERVRQLFGDLDSEKRAATQRLTLEEITKAVSEDFGVEEAKIVSRSRIHAGALPRKVCMYLARSLTDLSLHSIGAHYNRDYSTVIFNLKAAFKLISEDDGLAARVARIRNSLIA